MKDNKAEILELLNEVKRDGFNKEALYDYLMSSDFFTAPYTTQYQLSCEGGLAQHCLDVYKVLSTLNHVFNKDKYSEETLILVGLFHCIGKSKFYEKYIMNKKEYSESGSKYDSMGHFDWVSVEAYKVKDASERFICGKDTNVNSVVILHSYTPLSCEEMSAILNQDCNTTDIGLSGDTYNCMNKFSLVSMLHSAISLSTYVLENKNDKPKD